MRQMGTTPIALLIGVHSMILFMSQLPFAEPTFRGTTRPITTNLTVITSASAL